MIKMKMKFLFGAAAAAITVFGVSSHSSASPELNDISGHWAEASIKGAVSAGYVDGYEDKTFKPERNVSRAEFIKMAVNALSLDIKTAADDNWYTPFANAAVDAGIHRTNDFTSGDWNSPITRLEMARIAVRATNPEFQKKEVTIDDRSVMYNGTKSGLIQGLTKGDLAPDGQTTRAQSVTIIERIKKVKAGEKLEADKYAVGNAELGLIRTNIFTVMPEFFGGTQVAPSGVWDPSKLFVETPDGKYRGELDQLIAIDLEDPNDPNLHLLPDIEKLKWNNLIPNGGFPVKDYKQSYILLYKGKTVFNKDTAIYAAKDYLPLSIFGIDLVDIEPYMKGQLNGPASVFENKQGDIPAYIIPKKGAKIKDYITLKISAPARAKNENYSKTILTIFRGE
ncbi:hypothetical protein AV654_19590 [Paenibacillus elgii]|uniref:SLH domain-containing protein n=1 Tax=Paenibacillus elgii TaxID=189691 RepID=A0A163XNJ3_9BACL|nr:S-layer homology domain-containing protein [Paenibacillus elgii]KZE78181.1 hypothetical protein AV654_19590 [Paenibacillus elgii]